MNKPLPAPDSRTSVRPITVAITALGGQGGGVLADWIVELAEREGYVAQATSVPGVAQRTGATVYYIELFPKLAANREPVLALMPSSGDVDLVIAAELMEAGRAMLRGFVTPDRTTLIASTHREYAISEKIAMGDGIAPSDRVLAAAATQAKTLIAFDMANAAAETNSVISSVLFGAVAGAGILPFSPEAYERTIEHAGIAVRANLAGFRRGLEQAKNPGPAEVAPKAADVAPARATTPGGAQLLTRMRGEFPAATHAIIEHGIRRLADYQDHAYASLYLDRLGEILALDRAAAGGPQEFELTSEVARHLALWMSYEDTIRVADLKTRASRFERVRMEVKASADQPVDISEYVHPRFEEFCDTLPAALGGRLRASPMAKRLLGPLFNRGRRIRTSSLGGFLLLHVVAKLRRTRRATLKYREEQHRISGWLVRVKAAAERDDRLAVEVARCQLLVKGYGDTFARGLANYERIMSAIDRLPAAAITPELVARLRDAALADDQSEKLTAELARLGG